ncbi:serine/threonine-protein kinase [Actinoallomurus sp. CA-150999]|uniref:serine/threonine-protein kinase n=1 Tax=Actinoallomurus sp. CA-150999 TaxID=3239887 RepID=UPI003D8BDDED
MIRVKTCMNVSGLAPLGSYELLERVGEGATSVVYRATDRFGRTVAVKEPRREVAHDPTVRRRLRREARTMARVRSPYVAEALDACLDGDRPYLVTEYVAGVPLRDLVTMYGPLWEEALWGFAGRFAQGLAAVHGAGVLHRDLKPGNVMVVGGIPKIIDFGIAQETGAEQVTQPGVLTGTPGYVAPELIDGGRCSEASDVFSWAATVAFAATGRPPFGAGSLHGICFRVLRGAADLDGVPERLLPLLRHALVRDPAARPAASWLVDRLTERRPVSAA